ECRSRKSSAGMCSDDPTVATGDGGPLSRQLVKSYASGGASQQRVIRKPVAATVRIGLQGDELQEGLHYEVDTSTGIVAFAPAPAVGERITAGFEFDVPVRFDTDRIQVSVASFQAGDAPQVPVVEVRL